MYVLMKHRHQDKLFPNCRGTHKNACQLCFINLILSLILTGRKFAYGFQEVNRMMMISLI